MTFSQHQNKKVLVVEDDEDIRFALCQVLKALTENIDEAEDGATGLELAKAKQYDVVLTDVVMPEMDGLELCKKLRGRDEGTVLIVLTGYGTKDKLITAYQSQVFDFLEKPFNIEDLRAVVDRAFTESDRLRQEKNSRAEFAKSWQASDDARKEILANYLRELGLNETIDFNTLSPDDQEKLIHNARLVAKSKK